jgi:hypothetical protein
MFTVGVITLLILPVAMGRIAAEIFHALLLCGRTVVVHRQRLLLATKFLVVWSLCVLSGISGVGAMFYWSRMLRLESAALSFTSMALAFVVATLPWERHGMLPRAKARWTT